MIASYYSDPVCSYHSICLSACGWCTRFTCTAGTCIWSRGKIGTLWVVVSVLSLFPFGVSQLVYLGFFFCKWDTHTQHSVHHIHFFSLLLLLLPLASQLYLWGSPFLVKFFVYVTIFQSNYWGSHIPSSWMEHAGCVFVDSFYLSRTRMSGSFESVEWNACVHRLDLGLYSSSERILGNGVRILR